MIRQVKENCNAIDAHNECYGIVSYYKDSKVVTQQ